MALEKPDWPTFFLLPRLIDGSFIGFHEQKKKKKEKIALVSGSYVLIPLLESKNREENCSCLIDR